MNDKEMLVNTAKDIALHCRKQEECNEACPFYTSRGDYVCLFQSGNTQHKWDFGTLDESFHNLEQ